jgi:diguanylate cyclase (GGDEF)-like protein
MPENSVTHQRYTPNRLYWLLFWISLASFLLILIVAGLGIAKIYQAYVLDSAKENAIRLAQTLSAVEGDQLLSTDKSRVAVAAEDYSELNTALVQLMEPYDIVKVKVFSADGTIVFSSEAQLIGRVDSANRRLRKALAGRSNAKLETKGEITDLHAEKRLDVDVVETYVPIYAAQQQVIGAFEIYQDISASQTAIKQAIFRSLIVLGGILALVFSLSAIVVRKAARELSRVQNDLHRLATQDLLTGISNRGEIMHFIESEAMRLKRRSQYDNAPMFSLIMGDIDKFKDVNDTYGHAAGDRALKDVATIMKQELREYDQVGRYGGEEFMVLLPDTDFPRAATIAERIRKAVEESTIVTEKSVIHLTISLGVATVMADEDSFEAALKRVDEALYQAKSAGRNRVSWLAEEEPKSLSS